MFIIIITPKTPGVQVSLFYKTEAAADIAHANIYEYQKGGTEFPVLRAKDDFGHVLTIERDNLSHAILIDAAKDSQLSPPQGAARLPSIPLAHNLPANPDNELTA